MPVGCCGRLAPYTEVGTVQALMECWLAYSSSKTAKKLRKDRLYTHRNGEDTDNQVR